MLVISRKSSEAVVIGGNIEIIISDIGTDKVKLCINAPKEISIMRKELLDTSNLNLEAESSAVENPQFYEMFKQLAKTMTQKDKKGEGL